MALICDTGPLYAAMDTSDRSHGACAALLTTTPEAIAVPAPVLTELDWLTTSRGVPQAFSAFLTDVAEGKVTVVDLIRPDYVRVQEMLERYADLPLGFVDAAVLAIVERLGETKLATLDHRHFGVVRPRHVSNLTLLLGNG